MSQPGIFQRMQDKLLSNTRLWEGETKLSFPAPLVLREIHPLDDKKIWAYAVLLSDDHHSAYFLVPTDTQASEILDSMPLDESNCEVEATQFTWIQCRELGVSSVLEISHFTRVQDSMCTIMDNGVPLPAIINCMEDIRTVQEEVNKTIKDRIEKHTHESTAEELARVRLKYSLLLDERKRLVCHSRAREADVRCETGNLKAMLQDKDLLLQQIQQRRRTAVALPFETWHTIITYALSPLTDANALLPSSILRALHLERTQTLSRIARVCKIWHSASTSLLYKQLYLGEIGCIVALARSLASSQRQGGKLFERIQVIYLDTTRSRPCDDALSASLDTILSLSSNLRKMLVSPQALYDPRWPRNTKLNPDAYSKILFGPTQIVLSCLSIIHNNSISPDYSKWLVQVLIASSNVVQLDLILNREIHVTPLDVERKKAPFLLTQLTFENLKQLRIRFIIDPGGTPMSPGLHVLDWTTPRLNDLAIITEGTGELPYYRRFIAKNGSGIIRLDLRGVPFSVPALHITPDTLREFLMHCPTLQHLCYIDGGENSGECFRAIEFTNHPTLAYIDAWTSNPDHFLPVDNITPSADCGKVLRRLDRRRDKGDQGD